MLVAFKYNLAAEIKRVREGEGGRKGVRERKDRGRLDMTSLRVEGNYRCRALWWSNLGWLRF